MKELEEVINNMTWYVCDELCIHHKLTSDQDEMIQICEECKMGRFIMDIEEAVD